MNGRVPAPRLPPLWRAVNRALAPFVPRRFDPEKLLAERMAYEGLDDLGPDADRFKEGLAVYCESLERDADLHPLGRVCLSWSIFRVSLQSRLRIAADLRAGARPPRAPLIVCGLPRSGTTLLHRLLELADDAAGLPLWRLIDPIPPRRGPDRRYARITFGLNRIRSLAPVSVDAQHYMRPDLTDECGHLLRASFLGSMGWQAPAYGWLEWALRQDGGHAYRAWAAFLSRLAPPDRRLVLKDPFHAGHLDSIVSLCPEAMIVQTHRDPVEVVPSFHKLCTTMHAVVCATLDRRRSALAQTRWLEHVVARNEATRPQVPRGRLIDVHYQALIADPIGTVERIHGAFGLPFTGSHASRLREYLAANPQRRHGANPYSAEMFGQTADEIAERFRGYRERFGLASDIRAAAGL